MARFAHIDAGEVEYPESDGAPMGETGIHADSLLDCVSVLRGHFEGRDDIYIGGNQFMYWHEGDPKQVVCPDVYVAPGRPRTPPRPIWKVWEEGPPAFILELTSRSSRVTDLGAKHGLYEMLGVREFAVFDPLGEYLEPRLRLHRASDEGVYEGVEAGPHGLWSEVLGLWLVEDQTTVGFRHRDGSPVLRPVERMKLESSRAAAEAERANAEAERANAEAERADAEAERARRAEEELARLRAEIEAKRKGDPG